VVVKCPETRPATRCFFRIKLQLFLAPVPVTLLSQTPAPSAIILRQIIPSSVAPSIDDCPVVISTSNFFIGFFSTLPYLHYRSTTVAMAPTASTGDEASAAATKGRGRPKKGESTVRKAYVPTGRPRGRPPSGNGPRPPYVPTGRPRGRPKGSGVTKKKMPEAAKKALAAARAARKEGADEPSTVAKKGAKKSDDRRKSSRKSDANGDADVDEESG